VTDLSRDARSSARSVLYIRQHLPWTEAGSSARAQETILRLAAETDQIEGVTVLCGSEPPGGELPPNVEIRSVGVKYQQEMSFSRRKLAFLAFATKASWYAVRRRHDVVFASSTPLLAFVPAVLAKLLRPSTRLVLEVRDLWPSIPVELGALHHPVARWLAFGLERLSYRCADEVIVLSPGMRDDIRARVGVDSVVVPNGSSREYMSVGAGEGLALRKALGIPSEAPVLLYAGSIGQVNDPVYLERVIERLIGSSEAVCVVVVGSGPGHASLRWRLGATPRIHVLDRVPRDQVRRFFAAADLSLATFLDRALMETNSANKLFDSLAAGVPVAVNYGGWQAELLGREGAGVQLPSDPDAAVVLLTKILEDRSRLLDMGANATRLSEQFEWHVLFPTWRSAVLGDG
jgi:glycosyltransferase involved in cell wall biosynthesis